MIKPILQGDAFLADVLQASTNPCCLHLWWLGQSGFLVVYQNTHLLIDPYLSDSLTKKYAGTDKPHERMTEIVITPDRLDFIDVVTSSHNHTDHLDHETLQPLLRANPNLKIIVSEANRQFAADRLQIPASRLTGISLEKPVVHPPYTIYGLPSAHESVEFDEHGHPKFLGLIIQAGPRTIYHGGDTVRYDGMVELLKNWQIDIALLPINGRAPERGVAGNLSGPEAARLARELGVRLAIPMHFDMFKFNTASPEAFIKEAECLGQPFRVLQCSERVSLE
jgi:L-ascorbate metabolism protein UlaG (beta-lactamase superfamily)